eukprot:7529743-Pyramimonas_sp.AAC.1
MGEPLQARQTVPRAECGGQSRIVNGGPYRVPQRGHPPRGGSGHCRQHRRPLPGPHPRGA